MIIDKFYIPEKNKKHIFGVGTFFFAAILLVLVLILMSTIYFASSSYRMEEMKVERKLSNSNCFIYNESLLNVSSVDYQKRVVTMKRQNREQKVILPFSRFKKLKPCQTSDS